jgi:hypothetical protein
MEIVLDLNFFTEFISLPLHIILWKLFVNGGWIILLLLIFRVIYSNWIHKKRAEFLDNVSYALLAIDVPRDNEQGPKAVEHIFSLLAAAESGPSKWREFYIDGVMKTPISLEIISMEGYIQFLIRVPVDYRDLVEAAVYSQYPSAEIAEVEDYSKSMPIDFPSEEYDLWGAELILQKDSAYPIKTSISFEDPQNKDNKFKDPMAAILEVLGKVGTGENIWTQILIVPAGEDWREKAGKLAKKLLGIDIGIKKNILDKALDLPIKFLSWVNSNLFGYGEGGSSDKREDNKQLTPGERKVVEAIEDKISKLGFETKFRMIYWADKEVFFKGRGVAALIGAVKQFSTLDMNGFIPDKISKTSGSPKELAKKQIAIAKAFVKRSFEKGAKPYILNTEELATIFHFPMLTVKAPLLQRAEMKSSEAPASLPTEFGSNEFVPVIKEVGFTNEGESDDEMPVEMKEILQEINFSPTKLVEADENEIKNEAEDFTDDFRLAQEKKSIQHNNSSSENKDDLAQPPDNLPII